MLKFLIPILMALALLSPAQAQTIPPKGEQFPDGEYSFGECVNHDTEHQIAYNIAKQFHGTALNITDETANDFVKSWNAIMPKNQHQENSGDIFITASPMLPNVAVVFLHNNKTCGAYSVDYDTLGKIWAKTFPDDTNGAKPSNPNTNNNSDDRLEL